MRRPGGGIGSAVVRNRPLGKVAKPQANAISPRGASQIGSALGNHSTGDAQVLRKAVEPLTAGRGYSTPVGPANSLACGPQGQGRKLYGQSGSNQTYGPPAAGLPRIANTKGQWPDTNKR
jgi:hypothetical protein